MRRLVDASRVRVPVPVRSQPRWSRRIPTRIAHGIGHDHAWVFMDSIGNKAVNPKLAESAPNSTFAGRQTEFAPDSEASVQNDAAPPDSRTFATRTSRHRELSLLGVGADRLPRTLWDRPVRPARIDCTGVSVFSRSPGMRRGSNCCPRQDIEYMVARSGLCAANAATRRRFAIDLPRVIELMPTEADHMTREGRTRSAGDYTQRAGP